MILGKTKKDKKKKKQKKAKSSGGGLLKNLFGKNKEKKETKKSAKKQKKQAKQNKKTDKAMAKKQKQTDKKQAKAEKKQAKAENKAIKQTAKAEKKQAKAENKAIKQTAKAEKKQVKAENKAAKQRNFDLENALTTATMVKDAVAQNVPGADKYLNVNQDNDEEYMDNEVNSSGEKNIASTNKDEGFISKHKGLLIGGGIVLLAALGAVLIAKSRKSTPTPSTTTPVSGVGYIEPIELS